MTAKRKGYWWAVRDWREEFSCPECGEPIQAEAPDEGEPDFSRAWHDADTGSDWCGPKCAARYVARVREDWAPVARAGAEAGAR